MRFAFILPLVFAFSVLWPQGSHAQSNDAQNPEAQFKSGIAAFQKKDLKTARDAFVASLQSDATNPLTLFNLGLTELQMGETGFAMALWRKALAVQPGYQAAAQALRFASKRLEHTDIAHEVEFWDSLHDTAFAPVSLDKYIFMVGLLLAISAGLLLRYFGARRRALLDETKLPPFPSVAAFSALLFLVVTILMFGKIVDSQDLRGTIVVKKVEARSTPDANGTPLFDLYEGLEVIVRQAQTDWAQVTYPGGATGWVPRSSVFTLEDQVHP